MATHSAAPTPKRAAMTIPTMVIGVNLFVETAPWTGMKSRAVRSAEDETDGAIMMTGEVEGTRGNVRKGLCIGRIDSQWTIVDWSMGQDG